MFDGCDVKRCLSRDQEVAECIILDTDCALLRVKLGKVHSNGMI